MTIETSTNQIEYLEGSGLVNLISLAAFHQKTGVMTFLASGRWQTVRVSILKCADQNVIIEAFPDGQTISKNIRINQPVGLSFRMDFSKYICESTIVGLDSAVLEGQNGKVLLERPHRIEKIPRRAYQRQSVPKDLNIKVLFWHRGFLEKAGIVPADCYWQGQLADLSAGGLRMIAGLEKRDCFSIGQVFGIQFTPLCYQKPILVEGQLRHLREDKETGTLWMGIEFLGLETSVEGRAVLQRLLETVAEYSRLNEESDTLEPPSRRPVPLNVCRKSGPIVPLVGMSGQKFRQKFDACLQILQGNHLNRCVHIAVGDADESCGRPAAAKLNRVGISAGSAGLCRNLSRDFVGFGGFEEVFFEDGVDIRASMKDGAFAEGDLAGFLRVGVGMVAGKADIDGDPGVRMDFVRGGDGPAKADFLLDCGDADDGDFQFAAGEGPNDLGDDEGTGLVIGGPGDDFVAVEPPIGDIDNHRVADCHALEGVFFAGGADIHPDVFHFDGLFPFFGGHLMDGFAADDAEDGAVGGADLHPLADKQGRVHSADLRGIKVSFVVDMGNQQADFIHMAGNHKLKLGIGIQDGEAVSVHIGYHLVGIGFDIVPPDFGGGLFIARGAGGFQKVLQKLFGCFIHTV